MRLAAEVNQYLSEQEPWAQIKDGSRAGGTVLYMALRCVDSLKTLFTPFLPFTSQKLHELLGYDGYIAGPLLFREVRGRRQHTRADRRLRSWVGAGRPATLRPARSSAAAPLFKKLDPRASSRRSSSGCSRPAAA